MAAPARCSQHVVDSFKPLLRVEQLFGVVKVRVKGGDVHPPGRRERALALAVAAGYLLASCLAFSTVTFNVGRGDPSIELIPKLCILSQYATVTVVSVFCHGRLNTKIYRYLTEIDRALHVDLYEDIYKNFKVTTVRCLVALIVFTVTFTIILELDIEDPWKVTRKTGLLLLHFFKDVETLMFCRIISFIEVRLNIINRHLEKMIVEYHSTDTGNPYKPTKDFVQPLVSMTLTELSLVYNTIGKAVKNVNIVFNLHSMWSIVTTLVYIILAIWASLNYYRRSSDGVLMLLVITAWPLTRYLTILALAQLLAARPLRLAVADMFYVDYSLALSFVGVSTTYLIMFLQISHFY